MGLSSTLSRVDYSETWNHSLYSDKCSWADISSHKSYSGCGDNSTKIWHWRSCKRMEKKFNEHKFVNVFGFSIWAQYDNILTDCGLLISTVMKHLTKLSNLRFANWSSIHKLFLFDIWKQVFDLQIHMYILQSPGLILKYCKWVATKKQVHRALVDCQPRKMEFWYWGYFDSWTTWRGSMSDLHSCKQLLF